VSKNNKTNVDQIKDLAFLGSLIRSSIKIGTKAGEKDPSANKSRKILGILKATKKASVNPVAPKIAAMTCSLIKPRTRLTEVPEAILSDDLITGLFFIDT
jgi:hypothetical protein